MARFLLLLATLGTACQPEARPAQEYCERTADMFCDYYLRCGRMAADTPESCRATFLEACTASYQPHYVALEARGELRLTTAGLQACADHLATVPCGQQIFDLDGACSTMWEGLAPAGSACGPGIESFVCDGQSTCVIGPDLCGTCEPTVPVGASCEEARCTAEAACVAGTCAPRGLPGQPCDEEQRCVSGAWCDEGTCTGPTFVAVDEPCDQARRCPYKSHCIEGFCVEASLLGEPCGSERGCASGWCDQGTCAPFKHGGEPCTSGLECHSRACDETCVDLPGVCF